MRVLLRALLHRQTNSWLSEAACSTGSQLLGSALPSAAASYPVGQACISTVPKTTDRTPYRPAPDGSDAAKYWEREWRKAPDTSHKQRQPKDPRLIPKRMLHPTWETEDMEAFREALAAKDLSPATVKALVTAADQGKLSRDAATVLAQLEQLQQLQEVLPGVVAENLVQRWPVILKRCKPGRAAGPGQLDSLMQQLDDLLGPTRSRQVASGLMQQMPVRTVFIGSTIGKQLSELPSVWEEVLRAPLDLQQLPPSAYVWATWTSTQQLRRLQTLKDRFGAEDAAQVALACPAAALLSAKQHMAVMSTLQQLLGLQPGSEARHAAARHARLLMCGIPLLQHRAEETQAQLRTRLGLTAAAAEQQLQKAPYLLLHPSKRWRETLQALVQQGLLPAASELEQQQEWMKQEQRRQERQKKRQEKREEGLPQLQQREQEQEQWQKGVGEQAPRDADPAAAAAFVARAPELLLRDMSEVAATVLAMQTPVLASQEVPEDLPEDERLAAQLEKDEAVKELLRQEPQLLVMEAQEAGERLQQLRQLGALSSSWAQRVQDMLHSNSHFARVLTSPREQFDRVQQLVRSGTKDAPSDQELGLLDLLQMPAKEFKDMYPAAALAQQTQ